MIDFPVVKCEECDLHLKATNVGIRTRAAGFPPESPWPLCKSRALLVIGEAPGYHEDQAGYSWAGKTGELLHQMIKLTTIPDVVDVFLSNACRCRPPGNSDPTKKQMNACLPHLCSDICTLYQAYEGDLTILCCGASACRTLLSSSIREATQHQGRHALIASGLNGDPPHSIPVFATYHPAVLAPGRQPSLLPVIRDHFLLLERKLQGTEACRTETYTVAQPPPEPRPTILAVDIETYGIIDGFEQTVFHPRKSQIVDGVVLGDLIHTVSVSWTEDNTEKSTVFLWHNPKHRRILYDWLVPIDPPGTLVGQNVIFDISYLRACDPLLKHYLRPGKWMLEDIMLWNFLHSEMRPERALKPLARLFDLAAYAPSKFDYLSADDPNLLAYNALDTKVTLRARAMLFDAIAKDYGRSTHKLTPICKHHCDALLWQCLHMSEAGLPYNIPQLESLQSRNLTKAKALQVWAKSRYDMPLYGTGSQLAAQALVNHIVEAYGLGSEPRILVTKKTRKISTKEDNLVLFRELLPPTAYTERMKIRATLACRKHSKLVDSYTRPLLTDPARGLTECGIIPDIGITYPSWHVCPSRHELDRTGKEGGTIQARITCRHHGAQTDPSSVKACRTSRWRPGVILSADLSQIELRIAALLSGDPVMIDEYRKGVDRHLVTGSMLFTTCTNGTLEEFRALVDKHGRKDPTVALWRQMGKTANFLITFEGKAPKLCETIRKDMGIVIPIAKAQTFIDHYDTRYFGLRQWQRGLIQTASQRGFLEVFTGWSRSFRGGPAAVRKDSATVCNFPVQTTAAQLTQSAAGAIVREIEDARPRLHSVMDMNTYDALRFDCPPPEVLTIKGFIDTYLTHPPLLAEIAEELGRTVTIEYDLKETTVS